MDNQERTELQRLAEAAGPPRDDFLGAEWFSAEALEQRNIKVLDRQFIAACSPAAILALLSLAAQSEELRAENERLRRASRTRTDYDLRCEQCDAPHWLDTSLPSEVWNQIARPHELLCLLCIDERLEKAGIECNEAEFYFVGSALRSKLYVESHGKLAALESHYTALVAASSIYFENRGGPENEHLSVCIKREVAEARRVEIEDVTEPECDCGTDALGALLDSEASGVQEMIDE